MTITMTIRTITITDTPIRMITIMTIIIHPIPTPAIRTARKVSASI